MEKINNPLRRVISSSVLFGFLAILLCAPNVPNVRASEEILSGETKDIDYDVKGALDIFGTANLYQGAYAEYYIYAYPGAEPDTPGSTVNIYGCAPENTLLILGPGTYTFTGLPPVVTIYGSRFQIVETGESFSPPYDQVINGTLNVLNESEEVLFSLTIWSWSDVPIHLRAAEEERLEAELWVMPKVIHRHRRRPVIFATLQLPEGISKDDVDRDYQLTLYGGDNEVSVKANNQRIYQSCRRGKSSKVKFFAFFNLSTMLKALPDKCEEKPIQVCGRLKSGQEFYGNDTIKIVSPRKKHWSRRTSKYRYR
jgi:hypothetical protein